jgi:isopentenyl phosphate kinase
MDRRLAQASGGSAVVVKLGGSVVTDKGVAFSYRDEVVRDLGRAMRASKLSLVIVHGGGSFGHVVAKRYGLSSRKSSPSAEGVSETREAMFRLNAKVCASLSVAGLHPYSFSPFTLLDLEDEGGLSFIENLLSAGVAPVTFGDVIHDGKGFRILSGDTMSVELSKMLGATRCVMAMDVDGLLGSDGKLIDLLDDAVLGRMKRGGTEDATGGMVLKVKEALRMAAAGTEVRLVSGLRPTEFSKALKGVKFHGTTAKVPPGVWRG